MSYTDVMVDIETTGVHPNKNAILELAAVKFNLQDRTVSPDMFRRAMRQNPTVRHWDVGTWNWWQKGKMDIYLKLVKEGEDPHVVMRDFFDWITEDSTQLRFWSKPSTFDYPFVASYLEDHGQDIPFSYREANDLNTFIRGLYFPNPVDTSDEPVFEGVAHNALVDVLNQIKVLFHHADKKSPRNA